MHEPRCPNFLFIGPDKAGSTWLYEALRQHKEVYLSPVKELFFFDRFYSKGWSWYATHFKGSREHHRIVGEICHDYLFSPLACERIARDLPSAKLMVCLREPVQRAFSEYLYRVKVGELACDFETALRENEELIDHGLYAKHLTPYLKHFSRSQIFIGIFDDLQKDPQRFFDSLCDYLGLDSVRLSDELRASVLPAAKPRIRTLGRILRWVSWKFRQLGFPGVVAVAKNSGLLSRLLYCPFGPDEKPKMSSEVRNYLQTAFFTEVQRLDALLGTEFCVLWKYSAGVSKDCESKSAT